MTALADMTPEECDECKGMWCDTPKGLFILMRRTPYYEEVAWTLLIPEEVLEIDYPNSDITPRFDLSRAWNPDGTPPKGDEK